MTDRRSWIAAILAISGVIIIMIGCYQSRGVKRYSPARSAPQHFFNSTGLQPSGDGGENEYVTVAHDDTLPDSEREKASLNEMVRLMRDFAYEGSSSALLFSRLKESGQNPEISAQSNLETGSVVTITTRDPLFGTRYFRSIFERRHDGELMNFIWFEYRPGPMAMEEAEEMVRQVFLVKEPRTRTADVAVYNVGDAYEVMVNRIVEDHLDAEPFRRRYTREDLGVVEVIVQLRSGEHEE